ncbi:MAG TPA: protein kinase [Polyangiaceae bacterium]|nr:protein kinase [Polyangiaceae bacterium]
MTSATDIGPAVISGIVAPGHVLGRYELLMPIAAGGMAMVWAARLKGTRGFQKIVAVKTMLPKLSEDAQFEQMFLDEASLALQIRHPHVVDILDLGEQNGVLFLVMEWIDGVPLNQLMKASKGAGGIPLSIAVRIVMQASAGLHAAHELRDPQGQLVGLVHRDVSPQNILVTYDGVTKVVDFGVAKATAIMGSGTSPGQLKGKVGYMAPEQIDGDDFDRRADIFALGIVLYALTTGKHPFRRESDAATMYNICSPQAALPPTRVMPDYPRALEAVVLRALAKNPADRYQTANEFLRDLDRALPTDQRALTDDDVAQFVRKLVGDKLQERRSTLSDALVRADQNASLLPKLTDAPSHPSNGSISNHGITLAGGDTNATTELSGFARRRRNRTLLMGAALVSASAALVLAVVRWVSTPDKPPSTALPTQSVAPAAQPTTGPGKTETDRSGAERSNPDAAPSSSAGEDAAPLNGGSQRDNAATPDSSASKGARPPTPRPAGSTPPKQPTTQPRKKNDWRIDPGF